MFRSPTSSFQMGQQRSGTGTPMVGSLGNNSHQAYPIRCHYTHPPLAFPTRKQPSQALFDWIGLSKQTASMELAGPGTSRRQISSACSAMAFWWLALVRGEACRQITGFTVPGLAEQALVKPPDSHWMDGSRQRQGGGKIGKLTSLNLHSPWPPCCPASASSLASGSSPGRDAIDSGVVLPLSECPPHIISIVR